MARPIGQLDRALTALTIGVHQDAMHRRRALRDGYTGEFEQQFQVQLSGQAGNTWGFVDQGYGFEFPFLYAPVQRQIDFPTPHFRSGIELTNPSSSLVLLHAHCIGWTRSPENWVIGATVRFMVCAPMATNVTVPYNAVAHLVFQGYASLPEGSQYS